MTQRYRLRLHTGAVLAQLRAAETLGLRLAAEHVLQVANERVPIEEGTLERSGTATVDESSLTAAVAYDTPYAVRQHEDMTARHDPGRRAKYLESAVTDESNTAAEIIAAQVRRSLRG
ncbi:minor capsid protein [Streptomyces sp. 8L]|uniref:minor capsid protein n=1 Tax=Streptomyces sp. 8L TaxID=2877242 RepID=UPI001CD3D5BE|nr:minor capsid protein [Streptomyces sp. 8L]MCA1219891.1 minor capsid protein [Streptomyces sp. 8L]